MTARRVSICEALAAFLVVVPVFAAQQGRRSVGLLEAEKGKWRVLLDGQAVGNEQFEVSSSGSEWMVRSEVKIDVPGRPAEQIDSSLKLTAEGKPLRYEWTVRGANKVTGKIEFKDGTATVEVNQQGAAPFVNQFFFGADRVVVLDHNCYQHYAILARLYNWQQGGAQPFRALIPQENLPGNITVEALGKQKIEGAEYELLRVRAEQLELDLYVDKGRLVRLEAPSSKVVATRE